MANKMMEELNVQEEDVVIVSSEILGGETLRIMVRVKGSLFKRLWHLSGQYPVVWNDEDGVCGDTFMIQDPKKEKELEGIFKAYCLNNKIEHQS